MMIIESPVSLQKAIFSLIKIKSRTYKFGHAVKLFISLGLGVLTLTGKVTSPIKDVWLIGAAAVSALTFCPDVYYPRLPGFNSHWYNSDNASSFKTT